MAVLWEDDARLSMAESSGDTQLDALIEEFKNVGEGWRNRDDALGSCNEASEQFVNFLSRKGIKAYGTESTRAEENFGTGINTPEGMGYHDRPELGDSGHEVVIVEKDGHTYSVDWTAAQYGYSEFPMVQRLDGGQWQRTFSSVEWEDGREITSAFRGITTPISDLYEQIHQRGWQVTDVSYKDGAFQATVKNPHGETVTKVGRDQATALGAALLHIVRREFVRQGNTHHWVGQLEPIAKSYAEAPLFDPKAAPAWKALADDSVARAQELGKQLHIEVVDDPNPYHSPQDLWDDVRGKSHLFVSRAVADHPLWTEDQVVAFRICHDVLGHAAGGGDFGWTGENLATASHMPWLDPLAQKALFSEAIGQSAYREHYRGYGPTKVALLDDHFGGPENGPEGAPSDHTMAPYDLPEKKAMAVEGLAADPAWWAEHNQGKPLYHATDRDRVRHIMQNGLLPWDDTGNTEGGQYGNEFEHDPESDWLRARPGHVYLTEQLGRAERYSKERHDPVILQIDSSYLKPEHINPDEDTSNTATHGWEKANPEFDRWVNDDDGVGSRPVPTDVDFKSLGDVADQINYGHDPEKHTHPGIASSKTLAYRGSIPPEAITPLYRHQPTGQWIPEDHPGWLDETKWYSKTAMVAGSLKRDPNHEYESGILSPIIQAPDEYRDPEGNDPLREDSLKPHVNNLATQWWTWETPDGQPDYERMKRTIINCCRASILSSQKELYDNAIHYQDVMHLPPDDSNAQHYWEQLTSSRLQWNDAQGMRDVDMQHHLWFREGALNSLWKYLAETNRGLTPARLKQATERALMYITADSEAKILAESKEGEDVGIIEPKVDKMVDKAIREITGVSAPQSGIPKSWDPSGWRQENPEPYLPIEQHEIKKQEIKRYPGFMANACVAMAEVSRNADQILEAALEDVRHHDGGGHMFRAACLGLGPKGDGISYFSVKMITWAWMMICPKQSQLATVDRHMYEMLGRKGGQEGEPKREYFLAERQIRGSLDAMGYGHVPLGQGQWLLWDTKRNGPGLPHQDHSAFRGESPTYHGDVHWLPKPAEIRGLKGKTWLKDIAPQAMPYWAHPDIQAVRDQISDQWFSTIPKMYKGKNNIPWSRLQVPTPLTASAKNEVHIALDVPEPERWRIHQWFTDLDLMNSEPLDPEEYHVTVAYANTGLDNPALKHVHRLFNFAGMKFQGKKLTKFGDALVIELSSDNYADCADALNDWLEGEGISVSRHDGGFTPHITVAYTDEKSPGASIPPLSFRSPGMSFSVPRGRDELAPVWASLSPLAVALRPWDPEQAVGPSQTVQRLTRLLNAPQKFSATPTLQAAIDEWEQERHGMVHTGSAYDVRPADEGWFSHDTGTFVPRHDSKGNDTLLTKQGQGQGRVAYFEGQPVASVTWVETPHGYLIGSAYTHPDHRGKGLFNTLTQELRDSGQPVDAYRWENPWLKNKVRDWQHRVATDWPRSKLPEDEREKALGYGRRDRVKLKGRDGNYEVMYVLGAPYEGQVDVALEENPEGWKVERVNADEIEGHTTDEPWHHKYNPFHKLAPGYVGPLGLEGWHNSSNQGVEGVKREGFNFDLHQRGTWGTGAYTFLGNSGKGFNPGGPGEASTPITLKLNNGIHTVLDQVGAINRNDPGTKLMEKVWHEAGAQNHHDRRAALLNAGYDGVMVSKHLNEPYCAVAFDHPNYEVHDTPTKSSTGLMAVGDEPPRPGEYSYVAGQDKVQRTASENHEDLDWLLNAVGDSQPSGPQHNRPLNERDHDRETMDPIAFERKYDWDREGDVARGNEFTEWVPTETLAKFMEYERQPGGKDSWGNEARWKALGDHIEQHGPKNPIWLDYNHETGTAHVSEGNHRIQLALQRGIPALPTRVYRSRRKSEGAQPVTIDPSVLDPRDGWVPEYMKPSHLGLPTTTAYQPRLLSKTRQFFTRRRVAWEPVVLPGGGNSQDYRGYHANPCPACGEKEYTHSEDEDSEGRVREYWRCHSCGHYEDHRGLRSAGIKEADKLHDFLMSPKNRPDLQTPEAQQWLQYLQALHTPKNDPLTPWLTKQWKKNNIVFSPNSMMAAYSHQPNPYDYETNPIAYQNYQKMPQRRTLDPATLGHWADWYHSGHPTREGVDIMKMTTPDMHAKVDEWDTAVREEAERAREHKARQGDVVHKYGNGWTMQRLMSPEALEYEGNAMGSCVGSYADEADAGHTLIYSLRDKKSEPHVTLEVIPKKFEKPPFDLHEAIRNNSVLRSSLTSDDPHLQALRKGLEDKHAELGHKSPMYQKPAFDPERHFSDPYDDKRMEWLRAQPGYQPSDSVRGVPKQDLTPEEQHQSLYYNLRKQHENMRGEPVMTRGHIEQIQGQSNQVPKPEYQEMVKEFFGQASPEDRPYWPDKSINDIEDLDPEAGGYHPHGDYGVENHTKYDWAAMIEDGCNDRSVIYSRPKPETLVNAAAEHGQLGELANTLDRSMQDIEHNWISDNEYRFEDDEIARWAGLYQEDYKKPNPEYDPEDEDAQWEEPEIFDEQQWEDDIHLQRQEFLESQWEESEQANWLYDLDQLVRNARRSHQ